MTDRPPRTSSLGRGLSALIPQAVAAAAGRVALRAYPTLELRDLAAALSLAAARRSSGTGIAGRQATDFPPVATFQSVTTPDGEETTSRANRIPSRTTRPRTGILGPGVDHREDQRLPFVR